MPTQIYKTADGIRVPSVTTINKIGQETGGLIHWAWQLGMDNIDYRTARDTAAEAGTLGHLLAECAIKRRDPTPEELKPYDEKARLAGETAFGAFKQWLEQTRLEVIGSEIALVSERWRYGGCMDAVTKRERTRVGGVVYGIGDWKSGALYPDHLCQIAAYANLWNERHPDMRIEEFHLCRFNKETGAFTHHFETDLSEAWQAFKLKRELYDHLAAIKKRV